MAVPSLVGNGDGGDKLLCIGGLGIFNHLDDVTPFNGGALIEKVDFITNLPEPPYPAISYRVLPPDKRPESGHPRRVNRAEHLPSWIV